MKSFNDHYRAKRSEETGTKNKKRNLEPGLYVSVKAAGISRHSVSHTGVTVKVDPQHWRNANTGEDLHVLQFPLNDQRTHFSSKDSSRSK